MAKTDPYKRVAFRGVTLDERTLSALRWAVPRHSPIPLPPEGGSLLGRTP